MKCKLLLRHGISFNSHIEFSGIFSCFQMYTLDMDRDFCTSYMGIKHLRSQFHELIFGALRRTFMPQKASQTFGEG